jgi:hypothetical protein
MLMNTDRLALDYAAFHQYASENLDSLPVIGFDQGIYMALYAGRWERLPAEYNWKPYWGHCPEAKIVHFHGPKPTEREALRNRIARAPIIQELATGAYEYFCDVWEGELQTRSIGVPCMGHYCD